MRRSSGRPRHPGRLHVVSPGDLEGVGLRVLSGRPLAGGTGSPGLSWWPVTSTAMRVWPPSGWCAAQSRRTPGRKRACSSASRMGGGISAGAAAPGASSCERAGRRHLRRPGQRDHEHERDCVAQPCRPGSPGRPAGPESGGVGGLRDVPGGCRSGASSGWCAADYGARAWLRHRGVEGAASVPASAQAADRGCRCGWLPAERAWPRRPPRQPRLGRH